MSVLKRLLRNLFAYFLDNSVGLTGTVANVSIYGAIAAVATPGIANQVKSVVVGAAALIALWHILQSHLTARSNNAAAVAIKQAAAAKAAAEAHAQTPDVAGLLEEAAKMLGLPEGVSVVGIGRNDALPEEVQAAAAQLHALSHPSTGAPTGVDA